MSKTVTYAEFDLLKVKVTPKGLNIEFFDKLQPNNKKIEECTGAPHPDFNDALKPFNAIMADSLHLLAGWNFAQEHNRKNEEALKAAKMGYLDEIERCVPTGVIYRGEDETAGIEVTGSLKFDEGTVGLSTPRVTFAEATGYELPKAKELAENLKSEVWKYLFKNKRAQKDMFEESDTDKERPKAGLNVA